MNRALSRKIAWTALLSTLALLSFMLENLFPPLFLPGARLGFSNVFILLTALILGGKYAFITLSIKCLLGSLYAGNVSSIIYSLPAGIIALGIELMLISLSNKGKVSIVAVSIAGAVINTTIQNVTFCLVTNATEYLSFLPYLAVISIISGLAVGFAVCVIAPRIPSLKKETISADNTDE